MGLTSVHNTSSITIPTLPYQTRHLFLSNPPSNLSLPRLPLRRCILTLARRRSNSGRPSSKLNKSGKKGGSKKDENVDEDAFEALFKQLEEDLKKDGEFVDDDDEDISEEDLALLERELGEALAVDEDLAELLNMDSDDDIGVKAGAEEVEEVEEDVGDDDDDADYTDEEEEEEEPIKLRSWQLRRLAYALKVGRRKTSIKQLAAELCLDRAVVLELLREPPPNLLMLSAALPDKREPTSTNIDPEIVPSVPAEDIVESVEPETELEPRIETPIHVLQGSWSAQKRLKKVQVETLENVYRRTHRPTNAMISSIVHVTNLPRRRVVKWFEDKRIADGVTEEQRPYRRSASESVIAK
ncbi:protein OVEREXPRESSOR OF CATIONIC PEROXIDASE 3 [Silene latifolia]|uniref:protein OVEREXPRESSOR OF CATIONIC PEROXIDASE 3 n=1 Tax=Silene latifolia TaxID=37657 RepID=UPI003D782D2C